MTAASSIASPIPQPLTIDHPTLLHTLTGHTNGVSSVAISPDGKTFVSAPWDGEIKVWNLASGQEIRNWKGQRGIRSLAISLDGKTLISGADDKTIKVWNLAPGQELRTLICPTNGIRNLVMSPDWETLVSGFDDGTIKVWRVKALEY